jgi:hypothetical protein
MIGVLELAQRVIDAKSRAAAAESPGDGLGLAVSLFKETRYPTMSDKLRLVDFGAESLVL